MTVGRPDVAITVLRYGLLRSLRSVRSALLAQAWACLPTCPYRRLLPAQQHRPYQQVAAVFIRVGSGALLTGRDSWPTAGSLRAPHGVLLPFEFGRRGRRGSRGMPPRRSHTSLLLEERFGHEDHLVGFILKIVEGRDGTLEGPGLRHYHFLLLLLVH